MALRFQGKIDEIDRRLSDETYRGDGSAMRPYRSTLKMQRYFLHHERLRLFVLSAYIVLGIGMFVWVAPIGYQHIHQSLDEAGWISHQHDTPVWIAGDWMMGEYRECEMRTTESISPESRAEFPVLYCGKTGTGFEEFNDSSESNRYFHSLPITYYGRIENRENPTIWRCQRNTAQLTCKAIN